MRHTIRITALIATLSGVVTLVTAAQAEGPVTASRAAVFHLKFRRAGTAFSVVSDGGRYAFINNAPGAPPGAHDGPVGPQHFSGGTLVDEETGKHTRVRHSGCYGFLTGGPWLLFYCPSPPLLSYQLYSLVQRRIVRRGIAASTGMNPVAIGRDWIQYFVVKSGTYVFQNIRTQKMRTLPAWRAGGTTIPDLDSPRLAHNLCAPLRVPADWTPYARWTNYPFNEKLHAGTVTLIGRSAILAGTTHPDSTGAYHEHGYLERCGSHTKTPFATPPFASNAHALIADTDAGGLRLYGWGLPDLKPFVVRLPGYDQGLIVPYRPALSSRKLYLVDHAYQLWVAPSPKLPTKRTRR